MASSPREIRPRYEKHGPPALNMLPQRNETEKGIMNPRLMNACSNSAYKGDGQVRLDKSKSYAEERDVKNFNARDRNVIGTDSWWKSYGNRDGLCHE
jgi:hypothetical protein